MGVAPFLQGIAATRGEEFFDLLKGFAHEETSQWRQLINEVLCLRSIVHRYHPTVTESYHDRLACVSAAVQSPRVESAILENQAITGLQTRLQGTDRI